MKTTSTKTTSTTVSTTAARQNNNNNNKKRKKKKSHAKVAIPLVKGATAASLVKKRERAIADSADTSSDRSKRKKRNRNNAGSNNDNTSKKGSFSSTAESLAVISEYHTLNKRLEQNERDLTLTPAERERNALLIKKQQEAMGGLDRYQKASMYGAKSSKFVCADWVVPLLLLKKSKLREEEANDNDNDNNKRRQQHDNNKLRILDVGAIDNQYHAGGKGKYDDWLDAVPIDLHGGQHESVLQVDFFEYAHEYCCGNDLYNLASASATESAVMKAKAAKESDKRTTAAKSASSTSTFFFADDDDDKKKEQKRQQNTSSSSSTSTPKPFDAIVMSLVLNFQGDPRKRGDMLALAADPRLLKMQSDGDNCSSQGTTTTTPGMLFVALPSASLDNSRYCDLERFIEVVTNELFQFELVETKRSSKLILLAFQRKRACRGDGNSAGDDDVDDDPKQKRKRKQQQQQNYYYDVTNKTFDYRKHEMKRLQPAKPGAKRNNFAVILKSSSNR